MEQFSEMTPETWGWVMKTWHKSGGCIGSWHKTLDEAYKRALHWEGMASDPTSTVKIEFIRTQYKDRMQ